MFRLTRFRIIFIAVVVLAAFFFALYPGSVFGRSGWTPPLGLDLKGGTELTIAICKGPNDPPGAGCRQGLAPGEDLPSVQAATVTVLNQRVNQLGVSEAVVQPDGTDQILVQLPGVTDEQARATVGTTARLHFATPVAGAPPGCSSSGGCSQQQTLQLLAHPDAATSAFIGDQQNLYDPNCDSTDPAKFAQCQFNNQLYYPPGYHWKFDNNIDATDVTSATVGTDSTNGQIAVDINFNSHGAEEWAKITQAAYNVYTSNPSSPQAQIAIFLDNLVITAPTVQQGGQSNNTQITGSFTSDSAQTLANQISAGALPAQIGVVASNSVSATLGSQTVTASLIAGAVGLVIVILFMIGYYRFPGLLACAALLVYATVVYAVFKLFPVTLSLAGLAGFVLSVGMAVDANVLIFERTRDELRHGRSVPLAVETGFRRAFPAIRDSNISTIIACLVLGFLGFSVVQGFAITLGIGVLVSFFTAITVTRSLFAAALRWRIGRNPRAYTEIHEEYEQHPPKGRFDIVRSRNWFFLGSL
ncbi:MAG: protein translocase subunit SecD, partial [Candidatus Dormibacteraeota bacterium]|nr:protein translocase subunit SecD [Candidatus Dormibacteraeota bacterium]